jgi:hypothetical protein
MYDVRNIKNSFLRSTNSRMASQVPAEQAFSRNKFGLTNSREMFGIAKSEKYSALGGGRSETKGPRIIFKSRKGALRRTEDQFMWKPGNGPQGSKLFRVTSERERAEKCRSTTRSFQQRE